MVDVIRTKKVYADGLVSIEREVELDARNIDFLRQDHKDVVIENNNSHLDLEEKEIEEISKSLEEVGISIQNVKSKMHEDCNKYNHMFLQIANGIRSC